MTEVIRMQREKNFFESVLQKISCPYFRHRVSADLELYACHKEKKPVVTLAIRNARRYQAWRVAAVVVAVFMVLRGFCKLKKSLEKLF